MTGAVQEEELNAPETTGNRISMIKTEANKLRSEAGGKARSAAEEGKGKAIENLGSVSQATREAAAKLKGSPAEPLADYVTSAANSIEKFATRMQSKSVDDIIDDARELVRRSPVLVIAAAVAAGFVVSRFMKATSREDDWRA